MQINKYLALLPLSYMFIIFIISSLPGNSGILKTNVIVTILNPTVQNLLHIPQFGLLVFLWIITLRPWLYKERLCLVIAFIISVSYGLLDEVHQYFIPGRVMSLTDILLNFTGVILAISFFKLISIKNISNLKHSI